MARKKQSGGRKVEGWKAKSWFKVYAPEFLGKQFIGEIVSSDTANLPGRVLSVSLGELIQDYSKQNVKISFKINDVAGDAAYTQFHGHEMTKDFIRSQSGSHDATALGYLEFSHKLLSISDTGDSFFQRSCQKDSALQLAVLITIDAQRALGIKINKQDYSGIISVILIPHVAFAICHTCRV